MQTLGRVRAVLGATVKTVAVATVVVAGVTYLTVQTGGAALSFIATSVPTVSGTALAKTAAYALATIATNAAPQLVRLR